MQSNDRLIITNTDKHTNTTITSINGSHHTPCNVALAAITTTIEITITTGITTTIETTTTTIGTITTAITTIIAITTGGINITTILVMMITKVMAIGTIIRCRIMDMEGTITIGGSTNREITGETTGIIKAMGTIETIEEMTGKGVIGRTKRKVLVLVVMITIREGSI